MLVCLLQPSLKALYEKMQTFWFQSPHTGSQLAHLFCWLLDIYDHACTNMVFPCKHLIMQLDFRIFKSVIESKLLLCSAFLEAVFSWEKRKYSVPCYLPAAALRSFLISLVLQLCWPWMETKAGQASGGGSSLAIYHSGGENIQWLQHKPYVTSVWCFHPLALRLKYLQLQRENCSHKIQNLSF